MAFQYVSKKKRKGGYVLPSRKTPKGHPRRQEDDPNWNPHVDGNRRGGNKRYPRGFNRPT